MNIEKIEDRLLKMSKERIIDLYLQLNYELQMAKETIKAFNEYLSMYKHFEKELKGTYGKF